MSKSRCGWGEWLEGGAGMTPHAGGCRPGRQVNSGEVGRTYEGSQILIRESGIERNIVIE